MDALPARRVMRPDQTGGLGGAGRGGNNRPQCRASDAGRELSCGQPRRHLGFEGGEGLPEGRECAVECRVGRLRRERRPRHRTRGPVRIPVRLRDGG